MKTHSRLTSHIEGLERYDTVFVGYPNWWYDMPMAMYSFFEEYDFSGKTIIPFNVHNGSRFSSTISTIQELEPEAEVVEDGFTVSERDVAEAAGDVAVWLDEQTGTASPKSCLVCSNPHITRKSGGSELPEPPLLMLSFLGFSDIMLSVLRVVF